MLNGLDAVKYVLKKAGCLHPFRTSRILALAEILYYKDNGERMSNIKYVLAPGTFYIEGIKEYTGEDPCFVKHEGDRQKKKRSCMEYTCPLGVAIEEKYRGYLDKAVEIASKLDDMSLNGLVVNDPVYKVLIEG